MRLYLAVSPVALWEIDDKAAAIAKTLQQLFLGEIATLVARALRLQLVGLI